jgi:hypothetical protein
VIYFIKLINSLMFLNYFNNFKYININIIFIYFQIKHTLKKKNIVKLMESITGTWRVSIRIIE